MGDVHNLNLILEAVLLVVGILVGGRIFFLVGDVRKTLAGIESTRTEITSSLKRIEAVAETTDHVLKNEVAPTLQAARETLANLEVSTRAIAETTQVARRVAASVEDVQKLFTASGPIAQFVLKKAGGLASGMLGGISVGLKSVLGGRKKSEPKPAEKIAPPSRDEQIAIPGTETTNPVLHAGGKAPAAKKKR